MLKIPAPLWKIILQNKGFEGIKPTPNPKPNPDGSRTVKLTPAQWQIFQDNQKKAPVPVPAEPGKEPTDEISVTKDRSTSISSSSPDRSSYLPSLSVAGF